MKIIIDISDDTLRDLKEEYEKKFGTSTTKEKVLFDWFMLGIMEYSSPEKFTLDKAIIRELETYEYKFFLISDKK